VHARIQLRMDKVRTRFAPSPTGRLHIGALRTALYSYALAKHNGGNFLLRIEDTDRKREVEGSREEIERLLVEFGLKWDEHYVQSKRAETGVYKDAAEKLVEEGHAFYCQCRPRNAKKEGYSKVLRDPCRDKSLKSGAVKLRVPEEKRVFYKDYVLGKEIEWKSDEIADATLLKSDGFPTYHLAVVVDDSEMEISHVLRGYGWLPSTPIHLLVYEFLGLERPEIGHLTDILDPKKGGKLSKRSGSVSVASFLEEGYLPEALLNFVMLLGWAPKDNREFFSLEEFVASFDPRGFQKANPKFDRVKLDWMNGEYIRKLSDEEFFKLARPYLAGEIGEAKAREILLLVKSRIKKLSEIGELTKFFFEEPEAMKITEKCKDHILAAVDSLEGVDSWELAAVNEALSGTIETEGFRTGDFFMDVRGAITGMKRTPPINESMVILGKRESIKRLKKGLE
jgi:glutamyl-tRNA synthetase